MELSTQQSGARDQVFTLSFSQIKNRLSLLSTQFKKKPQLLLASVVGVFVLVGLVATISLVGVQQDIRQQAAAALYNATKGASCSNIPEGAQGCDSSNNLYTCVSNTWRVVEGKKCTAPAVAAPAKPEVPAVYAGPSICNEAHPSFIRSLGYCETATITP